MAGGGAADADLGPSLPSRSSGTITGEAGRLGVHHPTEGLMNQYPLVEQFMDRSFVRLRPEMDVYRAVDILLQRRITGAAVVNDRDHLVGVLSERDCLRTLLQGAYNSLPPGRVEDYMTREVRTIAPNTDIFTVADFFQRNVYRRLLIVEGPRLVGQITRRDLLRAIQKSYSARPGPSTDVAG